MFLKGHKKMDLLDYYNDVMESDFTDIEVAEVFFMEWSEKHQMGFDNIHAVKRCIGDGCYHTRQLPSAD